MRVSWIVPVVALLAAGAELRAQTQPPAIRVLEVRPNVHMK